jgi:hypothetical protein
MSAPVQIRRNLPQMAICVQDRALDVIILFRVMRMLNPRSWMVGPSTVGQQIESAPQVSTAGHVTLSNGD